MAGRSSRDAKQSFRRDPLPVPRVPPAEQEPGFLERLRARGEVMDVAEGWQEAPESLPPDVSWIRFPNGDLQRIRI